MAGGIRLALAEVLVDELGHGVRDDAGEVKRQIEWTTPKRLVLELMGPPSSEAASPELKIARVEAENALTIIAEWCIARSA